MVCAKPVGGVVKYRVQGAEIGTVPPIVPVGRGLYSQGSLSFFCFRGNNLIDSLQKRDLESINISAVFLVRRQELELT